MKKVRNAVALFLALIVVTFSALAASSRVLTVFNEPKKSDAPATFDVQLLWSDSYPGSSWNMAENSVAGVPFDSDALWEPGYTEIRYFKVRNNGSVAFDYEMMLDNSGYSEYENTGSLADAIDVYVSSDSTAFSSLISSSNRIGTLSDCFATAAFFATDSDNDDDNLAAGGEATFAVGFRMRTDAGNEYQGYVDESGVKQNKIKFTISASASAPEPKPVSDGEFGLVFENTDEMLYRVGNITDIAVSSLFKKGANGGSIDDSKVSFEWVNAEDYKVSLTYTDGSAGWTDIKLKFAEKVEGVGTLWLKYDGERRIALDLEVLTARNIETAEKLTATGDDAILLKNIETSGQFTVSSGKTLYGNGFTIHQKDDSETTGGTAFCTLSGGTLDNVSVEGKAYASLNLYYPENEYYNPCVKVQNNTTYPKNYIYNSHISGCSDAIIVSGETHMKNCLVSGGAVANIDVMNDLYMTDCTTSLPINGGAKGLAVLIRSETAHVTLDGTFTQYNWVQKSDFPSLYSSVVSDFYSKSEYASYRFTQGSSTYLCLGIMCANSGTVYDKEKAQKLITDNTGNNYGYITKESSSITATCYTEKSSDNTVNFLNTPTYVSSGQYPTIPGTTYAQYNGFNIANSSSNPNYKAMTNIEDSFCVYDSRSRTIKLSYGENSQYEWNPMILSLKKYSRQLSYTVSMNGTDYTNKKIPFNQPGNYVVTYNFTDPYYYYEKNGNLKHSSVDYTRTLNVFVIGDYDPDFTFGSYGSRVQIGNNEVFVMPDVSATVEGSIESVTKNGITVYYPVVKLDPYNEDGTEVYSEGNGAYFTPVFRDVNIKDYDQSNGNLQYSYNKSTTTWPHNEPYDTGPDSSVFDYVRGEGVPYGAYGESYYGFDKNADGLCYTRKGLDSGDWKDGAAASTKLVHWYYVSNNGLTYNYYVKYSFSAWKYNACLASGTVITLADGSRKPIEEITYSDKLLTWNFFEGKYDEQSVAILVNHGAGEYKVLNSVYSDGTVLRTIGEHGVFDYDLNKYVYLTESNFKDYIGHRFVKYNSNGRYDLVILKDAYITTEQTNAYSITSAGASNAFAEGLLTVAPPDDFYNWIDMGEKLRYDADAFNADVEKYGLYDYEVFKDYVTYEQFVAFNGPYLKIAVEKSKFSFDYIIELVKMYL